jgi:hypothetical protein
MAAAMSVVAGLASALRAKAGTQPLRIRRPRPREAAEEV